MAAAACWERDLVVPLSKRTLFAFSFLTEFKLQQKVPQTLILKTNTRGLFFFHHLRKCFRLDPVSLLSIKSLSDAAVRTLEVWRRNVLSLQMCGISPCPKTRV